MSRFCAMGYFSWLLLCAIINTRVEILTDPISLSPRFTEIWLSLSCEFYKKLFYSQNWYLPATTQFLNENIVIFRYTHEYAYIETEALIKAFHLLFFILDVYSIVQGRYKIIVHYIPSDICFIRKLQHLLSDICFSRTLQPIQSGVCFNRKLQYLQSGVCFNRKLQPLQSGVCFNRKLQHLQSGVCFNRNLQFIQFSICFNRKLQPLQLGAWFNRKIQHLHSGVCFNRNLQPLSPSICFNRKLQYPISQLVE